MRFIELLVEGVPGTKGVLEYNFEPGLNAWKQKGTFRLETVVEILICLLYPKTKEGEPLGPGKAQRAGLVFEARNQTYRLVRDFVNRKAQLSQLEPGGESFRDISNDSRSILETLTRSIKLPSNKLFRTVYVGLPGKLDWLGNPAESIGRMVTPVTSTESDLPPAERLEGLLKERANFESVKESERQMDELQASLFKIDDELKRLIPFREEVSRVSAEYERYQILDRDGAIPPNIVAKLKGHEAAIDRKESDMKELEERNAQWTQDIESIPVHPPWKEPKVVGGAITALLTFILAGVFRGQILFWAFMFPFFASVGVTGYGVFLGFRRQDQIADLRKKLKGVETERAGIEKKYEIETAAVRKLMGLIKESDPQEVVSMIGRWESLKAEKKTAEEALQKIEVEVNEDELKSRREHTQGEISRLEHLLGELPPVSLDPNAIDLEIQELQARISAPSMSSASAAAEKTDSPEQQDALGRFLDAIFELTSIPKADILKQAQKALDSNLASITGQKFRHINFNPGEFTQCMNQNDLPAPWIGLDVESKGLIFFAVQFTFWQMLAAQRPMPVLIDLISVPPTEAAQRVSHAAAKHLSQKTQVLLLSP